jgi:hypothetical protein
MPLQKCSSTKQMSENHCLFYFNIHELDMSQLEILISPLPEQLVSSTFFGMVCVAHLFSFLCYVMFLTLFVFDMCLVPSVACFSELSILAFIHTKKRG